jgi:hypothetical protein
MKELLGFALYPAPTENEVNDDQSNKSNREIEMDISPLMTLKPQKILGAF